MSGYDAWHSSRFHWETLELSPLVARLPVSARPLFIIIASSLICLLLRQNAVLLAVFFGMRLLLTCLQLRLHLILSSHGKKIR